MLFELTLETLQSYWWLIISILGGFLVFFFFVQGGQMILWQVTKSPEERNLAVNALGRKWELGFTTLVMFGGAVFASYPLLYATSFGGAYFLWMCILFSFIIQAVSYEYRSKKGNLFGKRGYEFFLLWNGFFGVFLLGIAVGTFFTGAPFALNEYNLVSWPGSLRGLESLGNGFNIMLGLTLVLLARILGAQYLNLVLRSRGMAKRLRRNMLQSTVVFVPVYLITLALLFLRDGYSVAADSGRITLEPHKYFHNLLANPLVLILLLVGTVLVLYSIYTALVLKSQKSFWFSGPGSFLVGLALFCLLGFNHTAIFPSTLHIQNSLTLHNASSGLYTLKVMSVVSLLIPFILAYITWVWKQMTSEPLTTDELNKAPHQY